MKIKTLKYVLVFMGLVLSQAVSAFDNNRQGFILGLGIGLHNIDVDFKSSGFQTVSESESGIATSFKIGGGITDQFALYYVRNASWYSTTVTDGFTTMDVTYTVGISGLGATYYFAPTAPSGYILGAFGIADGAAPFESNVEEYDGNAYMIGGGYEVSKGLHLEATYLVTDQENSDFSQIKLESSSIQFTVNYLWY